MFVCSCNCLFVCQKGIVYLSGFFRCLFDRLNFSCSLLSSCCSLLSSRRSSFSSSEKNYLHLDILVHHRLLHFLESALLPRILHFDKFILILIFFFSFFEVSLSSFYFNFTSPVIITLLSSFVYPEDAYKDIIFASFVQTSSKNFCLRIQRIVNSLNLVCFFSHISNAV